MPDLSVNRTLVKSPPELWGQLSEAESLERHLGELGEISITRLEPEHTVVWEGENARGTVELEASGWGTKVTLSAAIAGPPVHVADAIEDEPEQQPEAVATPRRSWLRRWFFPEHAPEPEEAIAATLEFPEHAPEPEEAIAATLEFPALEPDEPATDAHRVEAVFEEVLDALGAAHHRPFSRS